MSVLGAHSRPESNGEGVTPAPASRGERIATAALWAIAFVGTAYFVNHYYSEFAARTPNNLGTPGGDFFGFLHAARLVAAGHSPYVAKGYYGHFYVYTPLVAIALVPFAHAATASVWHAWVALSLTALVVFGVLVAVVEASRLRSWRLPLLLCVTTFTALHHVQTWEEVFINGNTDCFLLVILATSVLVSEHGRAASFGVLIGIAGVIKTWPAAAGVVVFRRGYVGRTRTLIGLVVALLLGPILTLGFGGISGLSAFLKATFAARSQLIVSYSVLSTPYQLFARNPLTHPVVVSPGLRIGTTVLLAAWVVGLLVLTLRWRDSTVLGFWNVMACIVLLVPVSHDDYTLYLLPMLWIWVARWLETPRIKDPTFVICVFLVLWWGVTSYQSFYDGSVHESAGRIAALFFANLAALTVSVLGDHLVRVRSAVAPPEYEARTSSAVVGA